MGIGLIVLGILLFLFWSNDIERGRRDPGKLRLAHMHHWLVLAIYLIAIVLVIIGIIVLLV